MKRPMTSLRKRSLTHTSNIRICSVEILQFAFRDRLVLLDRPIVKRRLVTTIRPCSVLLSLVYVDGMASWDDLMDSKKTDQDEASRAAFLRLSETRQTLSPVPENVMEGSNPGPVSGQFSDAIENSIIQDNASAKIETASKRDSKIDDHFRDTTTPTPSGEEPHKIGDTEVAQEIIQCEGEENIDVEQQDGDHRQEEKIRKESQSTSPVALSLLLLGICLAVLLISLDRTIITTVSTVLARSSTPQLTISKAIPDITNEFHSTDSVGWYGSAYLVTACAFQPTYGKIFTLFDTKWTFLHSVALFEIGSLICAVAPNSAILIIGRAIAGWGSAGMLTGAFVVIAKAVPLRKRPLYTAAIGVMYCFLLSNLKPYSADLVYQQVRCWCGCWSAYRRYIYWAGDVAMVVS
jgi:hypothetical protein